MTLALALLAIFAIIAVLMYLNRLPAIVALPIMAVAIGLAARLPWRDLANMISDGAFLLHQAYATAILGAILAEIVSKAGIAETIVKKAAELGGDRPLALALLLTAVVALLFTTLGGLGAVIMVATIVFPILLALGIPRLTVGALFLFGMSLGGIFNLTNWQLYRDTLKLPTTTILIFAAPLALLMAVATIAYAAVSLRPSRLRRYWQDPDPGPPSPPRFAPWYALLTPIVPLLPVLGFGIYNLLLRLAPPRYAIIPLPLHSVFLRTPFALLIPHWPTFDFPIVTAMVIGIAYGLLVAPRPQQGRIQLLARSAIDGIAGVAPAVALMLGIGMLVVAVRHPLVTERVQPILTQVLPHAPLTYVIFFTLLAPLALYRGPLNIWGMGFGLAAIMAKPLSAPLVMAALLSVGQLQGVCDPTNTHNVWIANYVGVDVQRILRTTLLYVWAAAALGLLVAAFLFPLPPPA